ncbi:MAG TPA: HupE/UreJ family protein [Polyangiaceae bacterium]|jgi:hydrogenase/urease accessory protein HupE|nr:HupE/UreJ family protein [Polyangiaceae bacterium]
MNALGRAHRALLALLVALGALVAAAPALAHEMTMAEMEVRETARGDFFWQWSATNDKRPMGSDLVPHWPESCSPGPNLVRCGEAGLKGALSIEGVGKKYSAAIVKIYWLDGQSRVYTITKAQPRVELFGGADDRRGKGEIFRAYTLLGVQHILSGIDHLLFVASLLFLVGFRRRLLATITAFTLAHSLTLASSVFGWISLRSPPVEASIALSIVLVASEALREKDTLARRAPALVSFLFGLVHGLGFAGALRDVGLPQSHLPLALFSFNLGVELGQLFAVLAAYAVVRLPFSARWLGRARTPALYVVGAVAAYWSWSRIAALVAA